MTAATDLKIGEAAMGNSSDVKTGRRAWTTIAGRHSAWCLLAILSLSGPLATSAQTQWPDFMPQLHPGLSQSPARVVVWSTSIEIPGPDVPVDKARWSGSWTGWACEDQVCDTKLIVEKVTARGASIIYGFASASVKPFTARLEATFVGDELMRSGRWRSCR